MWEELTFKTIKIPGDRSKYTYKINFFKFGPVVYIYLSIL